MSDNAHEQLLHHIENYIRENESFDAKGVKAAGTRARKHLMEISKLCKDRRKEIQDVKNAPA